MATLFFKIGADFDNVIRLRNEITKLEAQLKNFGKSTPEQEIRRTEEKLASARGEFTRLTTEAAKAGAVMERELKQKIDSATRASDELSEEIIKQRRIIRETREDVRMLSEQYSKLDKYSSKRDTKLAELNLAKAALNEQRYALGELQEQQAKNRLEVRRLNREYQEYAKTSDKATSSNNLLANSIRRTVLELGGAMALRRFSSEVLHATGTMQQLRVALSTILQDKEKADALISEIIQFAAKTPFNLEDVAAGAKQLLAYGSSAENVVKELSMLGDVAAGLQIPIGQLIYLYGTLRTQGRAMTIDIRQFAGRGIPIYEELAKVLGVTEDQVEGLVSAGKVGFKEVEQAFKNMTSEGGKFNNLMENSAGTWPQQIANIQDKLFQKLNEFGEEHNRVFELGIEITDKLVENLDDILAVIGTLIIAYGAYKAAVIAVAVVQEAAGIYKIAKAFISLAKGVTTAKQAMIAFNTATKANPIGLILSVLATAITYFVTFSKESDDLTESLIDLNEVMADFHAEVAKEREEIDRLFGTLEGAKEGSEEYKEAKQQIIDQYGKYLGGLIDERGELINLEAAYNRVTAAAEASAKARAMTDARSDVYKNYTEKMKETQDDLREFFEENYDPNSRSIFSINPRAVEALITRAVQGIEKNGKIPDDLLERYPSFKRLFGREGNDVRKSLLKMEELYKARERDLKKIEQVLGNYTDSEDFAQMTDSQLKANLETLKKVLARFDSGATEMSGLFYNYGKRIKVKFKSLDEVLLSIDNYEQEISRRAAEASVSDNGVVTDITEKISATRKRIDELQKEIAGLRNGTLGPEAGKDIKDAINEKIKELQAEQNSLQTLVGKSSESYAPGGSRGNTAEEEAKARAEAEEKAGELLRRIIEQNQKDELALMKDGAEKRKAQAAADLSARLMEARDMARQMKEANMAAGKGEELDTEQVEALKSMYDNAAAIYKKAIAEINEEERKANEEAHNAYIRQYGDYQEKRKAIADEYAKKIEEAGGEDTWQGKLLAKERDKEYSDLDFEAAKTTSKIGELFDDMTDKTLKDLERIYDYGKLLLDFLSSGKWDAETGKSLGISEEQFNTISKDPEKLKATSDNLKNVKETADEMRPAISKITKGFHDLFNSEGDSKKLTEALSLVSDGVGAVTNALGFLSDSFTKIFEAFGSDAFSGVADGIKVATDTLSGAMSGAQAGAAFGPIGAGVGAALGLVSSLASSLAELHDAKIEEKIQDIEDSVENLDKAYEKLGREADKAFSTEAAGLIGEQNKNLQQQKRLIEEQIALEQTKKDADDDRIKDWRNELDEINEKIEDNKEAALEAITGTDIMSAIDEFAQAYADAWANGTSAAKASADVVKSLIRTSMLEQLKNLLNPKVQKFMEKLGEFMKDGVLEGWEKTTLDAIAKGAEDVANSYMEQVGGYFKEDAEQQSASARAFGTEMTQDQGAEISGRLTAVYDAELGISEITSKQLAVLKNIYATIGGNVSSEGRNMVANNYKQQVVISFPTLQLNEMTVKLNEIGSRISDLVNLGVNNDLTRQNLESFMTDTVKKTKQIVDNTGQIAKNVQ